MNITDKIRDYWQRRIAKPVDVIKQPWLDLQRAVSRLIYQAIKRRAIQSLITDSKLVGRRVYGD